MKRCKVEGCKNLAGKNKKTGKFYDTCDFHHSKKMDQKKAKAKRKPNKMDKPKEPSKNMAFKYDPKMPLVIDFGSSFIINHPKKVRYIRKVPKMKLLKEEDLSITISVNERKSVNLPFKDRDKMEQAYQELWSKLEN